MFIDSYMPVKVISGKDCLIKNSGVLNKFGKKCLIVTGKRSAIKSGALQDAKCALEKNEISYVIFDEIEPNPETVTCKRAGDYARENGCDFVFGVGGGSVLDASKAIAIFAENPSFEHTDIYARVMPSAHLPVVLMGTTAGTGSEVTGVSVLTNSATGQKKSISGADCYADISFCDYKYSVTADVNTRISTALDAFAHAVESFVASSANELSDAYAIKAIKMSSEYILSTDIWSGLTDGDSEILYISSIFAGLAINIAGTCFPHTVGYYLTENYNVPHGKACAVLMPCLLERAKNYCPERLEAILDAMKTDYEGLICSINALAKIDVIADEGEIAEISLRWKGGVKNFDRTPGGFSYLDAKKALADIIC